MLQQVVISIFYAIYGGFLVIFSFISYELFYLFLITALTCIAVSISLFLSKGWALILSNITTGLVFLCWCCFLFILWGIGGWPSNLGTWPLFIPSCIFLLIKFGANFYIRRKDFGMKKHNSQWTSSFHSLGKKPLRNFLLVTEVLIFT